MSSDPQGAPPAEVKPKQEQGVAKSETPAAETDKTAWYPTEGYVQPATFRAEHLGGHCHFIAGKGEETGPGCSVEGTRRKCTTEEMVKKGECNMFSIDVPVNSARGNPLWEALDLGTKIKLQLWKARTVHNEAKRLEYTRNARALARYGKFAATEMWDGALRFLTEPECKFLTQDFGYDDFKKAYDAFDKEDAYYSEIESGKNAIKVLEMLKTMSGEAFKDIKRRDL